MPRAAAMAIRPPKAVTIGPGCLVDRGKPALVCSAGNTFTGSSSPRPFRRKEKSVIHPIIAPKHFRADEEGRGAEDPAGAGLIRLLAQARLDGVGLGFRKDFSRGETQFA